MEVNPIEEMSRSLRLSPRRRQAIERELQAHVDDTLRDLELAGWSPDSARKESLDRLGDPQDIARDFERAYRPRRRNQIGLAVALATGLIMGVYGIGGSLASAKPAQHQTRTSVHTHSAHQVRTDFNPSR
jgi:hypothetical protein